MTNLGDRAPIQFVAADDPITRAHESKECQNLSRMPTCSCCSASPIFKRGNPFLQYSGSRIGQSRINIAESAEIEERSCMINVLKHIRRRLVHRRRPSTSCGVWRCTRVNRLRGKSFEHRFCATSCNRFVGGLPR